MNSPVCVDANLVLKLLLHEPDSALATMLWSEWITGGFEICAPPLLEFEVVSVLRNKVHRGRITAAHGNEALRIFRDVRFTVLQPANLIDLSWELAARFDRPAAYDSCYLALAQIVGCDFWTADERLYNTVKSELAWVRCLKDYTPAPFPQPRT